MNKGNDPITQTAATRNPPRARSGLNDIQKCINKRQFGPLMSQDTGGSKSVTMQSPMV
jgi:hypothetical protein